MLSELDPLSQNFLDPHMKMIYMSASIESNVIIGDRASVIAMKQTCVIVILAYLPDFNLNHTENVAQTLKYQMRITFLQTKASAK